MQSGSHTVGDGMRRHLVTLERERENLEQAIQLCGRLKNCQERLQDLDAGAILEEVEVMEQSGATFQDKQRQDVRVQYTAPVAIAVGMILLMGALAGLFLWGGGLASSEVGLPALLLMAALAAVPLLVAAGVFLALVQRIREIERGEEFDAKNY